MAPTPVTIFVPEIEAFGGAERAIIALSRWLRAHDLPHRVLIYYDHVGLATHASHPMELVVLNPVRAPLAKVRALKRYVRALPDGAPAPLMSGIQAATHASLAGIRGFHTLMHDTPSLFGDGNASLKNRLRETIRNRALARGLNSGGTTIVTSAYLKAETERLWHASVAIARMGGIAAREFRPRAPSGRLHLLSVSRVEANKRIDWVLRALAMLESRPVPLSRETDWSLDIVGAGSRIEALRALTRELGLAGRVAFHGFVSDTQLEQHFDRTDLFLMPARQGYGIPAAEALARGIPVMLHRESGISDLLTDTDWATVMDGGEDRMLDALERAITSALQGRHVGALPPAVPTEDDWAARVAGICGWQAR